MDKVREEFEAWYLEHTADLAAEPIGSRACYQQWGAWQAARQPQERGEAVATPEMEAAAGKAYWGAADKGRPFEHRMAAALDAAIALYPHPPADAQSRIAELEAELSELRDYHTGHVSGAQIAYDDFTQRIASLEAQLAEARTELEKETAQSKHLAEAMSRKIQELIAAENQCAYYKGQYTRTEQVRKEACEANAKAQAKTLWLEDELAESRERETDWMSTAAAMLNATYEQRKALFESTCANYSAALAAEKGEK